jgi:hypothetical protein
VRSSWQAELISDDVMPKRRLIINGLDDFKFRNSSRHHLERLQAEEAKDISESRLTRP